MPGSAFFGPAFDAVVPDLVPEAELPQANSLDQFVRPALFRMLGPAVGGWIIALSGGSAGPAFFADAGTFAVSIGCLLSVGRHPVRLDVEDDGSMAHEIAEGLRYVRTRVWLWGTFLAATLAYLIFWGPAEVLLPFIVKQEMGGSAGELGLVFAIGGVGAMLAALYMSNRDLPRRNMTFMYLAWTVSTLMVAVYGLADFAWQLMAASFVFNALESRGADRVDDDEATPHPGPPPRPRLEPRLVHLDRSRPDLVRADGTGRGRASASERRSSAPGSSAPRSRSRFLFLPGMRAVEGLASGPRPPRTRRRSGAAAADAAGAGPGGPSRAP